MKKFNLDTLKDNAIEDLKSRLDADASDFETENDVDGYFDSQYSDMVWQVANDWVPQNELKAVNYYIDNYTDINNSYNDCIDCLGDENKETDITEAIKKGIFWYLQNELSYLEDEYRNEYLLLIEEQEEIYEE